MSINDAKWTTAPDVLASSITSFLLLTFVWFHEKNLQCFPLLVHRCFRCRNFHSLRHANQLHGIRRLTFRWILSQFLITSLPKFPRSIVTFIGDRFSFLPITLLQQSHCTFVLILFWPFCRLFINLTMCEWAPLPKPATALGLVEQAFWRVPLFTKWVISSSFEVILARSSRYSTTRTCASGTSGPRWFSLILPHERIRRRIWWCSFFHDFSYRGGNCNCFLSHTARWFPIANNLQEFFVHAVLFPDSWPRRSSQNFRFWLQSSYFEFLAQYFFSLFFNLW